MAWQCASFWVRDLLLGVFSVCACANPIGIFVLAIVKKYCSKKRACLSVRLTPSHGKWRRQSRDLILIRLPKWAMRESPQWKEMKREQFWVLVGRNMPLEHSAFFKCKVPLELAFVGMGKRHICTSQHGPICSLEFGRNGHKQSWVFPPDLPLSHLHVPPPPISRLFFNAFYFGRPRD